MGLSFWNDTERVSRVFFRQRDDGDWDFFPNIGRGYRVNAPQRERVIIALRSYEGLVTVAVILAFALGTLGGASEGSVTRVLEILAIFFVASRGYRFIRLRALCRDLPRTESREAQEFAKVWRDTWRRRAPVWQVFSELMTSPLIVTFSVFLLWHGVGDGNSDILIVGFICLLSGIAGTWHGIDQCRMRRAAKRQGG